jgi:hypothetical protein
MIQDHANSPSEPLKIGMTLAEAIDYADKYAESGRRKSDAAIRALMAEVRRLQKIVDEHAMLRKSNEESP